MKEKKEIKVPKYTLGEEITNAVTHGIGAGLGIAALVLAIVVAARHGNAIGVVSACIYGTSMIFMYLISCLYHSLSPKLKAKKVFRVIDHCDIYVFIAGCYTPYCLSLIGGVQGWVIFSIVWLCALVGILLNAINLEKFKTISFILYLVMGWMILFSLKSLVELLATTGLILLVAGGIVYTLGALLYLLGHKKKYLHSVFHVCIVIASVLQFLSILLYAL